MATPDPRNVRRYSQDVSYTVAAPGYKVYKITKLGQEGRLVAALLRMKSGAATTCAIRVFEGDYDETTVNPASVPDENVVYDLPAAAIVASATAASINENIVGTTGGAYYGRFDLLRFAADRASRSNDNLFVALTFDDACEASLLLRADLVA